MSLVESGCHEYRMDGGGPDIACALGESVGMDMELSEGGLHIWERAERELPAAADHTQIAQWLQAHESAIAVRKEI